MYFSIEDIITTDGYLRISEAYSKNLCHIKTDYFKRGCFKWRGEDHPKNIKSNVIISHSDYPVDDSISSQFEKVFCVNNDSKNLNTYSLPLGIPNFNKELEILEVIGDKNSLLSKMSEKKDRSILLYVNFSVDTFPELRSNLLNLFSDLDWVYKESPDLSHSGRSCYLDNLKKSKFVLCPRGNGIDTHRLWESLYLGAIPIIERFKTHDICWDLPVLFIDKWEDINEDFLNDKYNEITSKEYNLDKLKISYWENFIIKKIYNNV